MRKAEPPMISPVPDDRPQPFWSVMVPAYRPDPHYLEETLAGVLEQDPGPKHMQIEVVLDGSLDDEASLTPLPGPPGRIHLHRQEQRRGIGGNWNSCVDRAAGRWVHILHQDDVVLPGFYERLHEALEPRTDIGAAFTQHYLIDEAGHKGPLLSRCALETPGLLHDPFEYVFVGLSFQTPALVVRREVYETLGGFDPELEYVVDWEMWKRIALAYPIWFDPKPLACFRKHPGSTSSAVIRTGRNMVEIRRSIERSARELPAEVSRDVTARTRAYYLSHAVRNADALFTAGGAHLPAMRQLWHAARLGSPAQVARCWRKLRKRR